MWFLVDVTLCGKQIEIKWVYETKLNNYGEVEKFKTWLVIKECWQNHRIKYVIVFAPLAEMDIIKIILGLDAHKRWKVYQLEN